MNQERYNRQVILPGFGIEAQQKLGRAKVLVIGAGGLGVPILTYLNAMGIGTLGIIDRDKVSLSNLHRQVLYSEEDLDRSKVAVALEKLEAQNSETRLIGYETFLTTENALEIIAKYDMVVDASDNFPTRYLVNDACVILKKPFVYGALHGFEGQVSVFNYKGGPTYRCLFPMMPQPDEIPDCDENGVLGILPGIIGNFQALETVKVITGIRECLSGKLLLFDALLNSFQKISFSGKSKNLRITKLQSSYDLDCQLDPNTSNPKNVHPSFNSIEAEVFLDLMASTELRFKIAQSENSERNLLQIIDVRTEREFSRNHLFIAKNIPLSDLEDRQNEIDFNMPVYITCQSGMRSKKAVRKLLALHPDADLVNISGGMNQIKKYGVTT